MLVTNGLRIRVKGTAKGTAVPLPKMYLYNI
jgi:hypothetical protein